jgi:hypothetical protein
MEYPGKKSILLFQYSMYMEKHGIKSMLFHGKHGKYSMQHGKCSMFFPCFSSPFFLSFRLEKAGKFCSNTPASYFPWKSLEKHGLFTPGVWSYKLIISSNVSYDFVSDSENSTKLLISYKSLKIYVKIIFPNSIPGVLFI